MGGVSGLARRGKVFLRKTFVFTQYKAMSLDWHISPGWRSCLSRELGEFIGVVSPATNRRTPAIRRRRRRVAEHLHDREGAPGVRHVRMPFVQRIYRAGGTEPTNNAASRQSDPRFVLRVQSRFTHPRVGLPPGPGSRPLRDDADFCHGLIYLDRVSRSPAPTSKRSPSRTPRPSCLRPSFARAAGRPSRRLGQYLSNCQRTSAAPARPASPEGVAFRPRPVA